MPSGGVVAHLRQLAADAAFLVSRRHCPPPLPPRIRPPNRIVLGTGTYVDLGSVDVDDDVARLLPPHVDDDVEITTTTTTTSGNTIDGRSQFWIVLIDDEPSIRLAVGDYLHSAGYTTVTACDGPMSFLETCLVSCSWSLLGGGDDENDDATGRAMNTSPPPWMGGKVDDHNAYDLMWRLPDCVISDIRMPGGIDGIDLLRLMRTSRPIPPISATPVTAGTTENESSYSSSSTRGGRGRRRRRGRPRKDGIYDNDDDHDYLVGESYDGKDDYDLLTTIFDGKRGGGGGGGGGASARKIITPADQAVQYMDAIHGCISYLSKYDRRSDATSPVARDAARVGNARRRRLQRRPNALRDVPVILLTARAMISDRIVGYDAGAEGYLPKPFRPEELLGMIDNSMRRRRRRREMDDMGGGLAVDDDRGDDIVEGESRRRGTGGDLTTEQFREIANDLIEIRRLIQAQMTSMEGANERERMRSLLPEAIWMYRTGERRKRVFTRDHIKSILSSCYDVDVTSKRNARWEVLLRELEDQCTDRPEGLLRLNMLIDN